MTEDLIQPIGELNTFNIKPDYNLSLHKDAKQIGKLDFNGPALVFTGDAEESAKVFIDWVAKCFERRLADERAAERERLADLIDRMPFGDTAASFSIWVRQQR